MNKKLFATATVNVSDTLSSTELSPLFSIHREIRDANCKGVELPKMLSLFKHSESGLTFVCEPWGHGVATLTATYYFKTQAGEYRIRPEFYCGSSVCAVKGTTITMLSRDFYDTSLDDFLSEMEEGISGSSCIISSDAANVAASNFRLEFRSHTMTRTYKSDKILFTCDADEENETFSLHPAESGNEIIVRFPLAETVKGIIAEMVRMS